ncbi:MAG: hypothetical protein AMJ95_08335 [Omnitrophica WOR_2 bacterium SM23_72]|nr:MAG: hypothetical protein AMJ95_08335 [Omnitrophica WOR_2 bacterium SM23_72]
MITYARKNQAAEKTRKQEFRNCHTYSNSDVFAVGCGTGGFLAAALLSIGNSGINVCDWRSAP